MIDIIQFPLPINPNFYNEKLFFIWKESILIATNDQHIQV